jgi:beta-galactosidase
LPNADAAVTFAVSGPGRLAGVANGDPAAHTPHGSASVDTFGGLARAYVASSAPGATGGIVVTAAAAGLQPGNVRLIAV